MLEAVEPDAISITLSGRLLDALLTVRDGLAIASHRPVAAVTLEEALGEALEPLAAVLEAAVLDPFDALLQGLPARPAAA